MSSAASGYDFTIRLPAELLADIFALVVAEISSIYKPGDLGKGKAAPISSASSIEAANQISHVCSRWRQTAIGMPVLWSRISLTLYSSSRVVEHFCKSVFPRLKGYPCWLQIQGTRFLDMDGHPRYTSGLHPLYHCAIIPTMEVKELALSFLADYEYNHPELLDFLSRCRGKVRSLVIDMGYVVLADSWKPSSCEWDPGKVVAHLPYVRRLRLQYIQADFQTLDTQPWPPIEELELVAIYVPRRWSLLVPKLPHLRKLVIYDQGWRNFPAGIDDQDLPPPSLPKVTEIRVPWVGWLGWNPGVIDVSLRGYFPSLRTLEVSSPDKRGLQAFLTAHPNIQHLVVHMKRYSGGSEYLESAHPN